MGTVVSILCIPGYTVPYNSACDTVTKLELLIRNYQSIKYLSITRGLRQPVHVYTRYFVTHEQRADNL